MRLQEKTFGRQLFDVTLIMLCVGLVLAGAFTNTRQCMYGAGIIFAILLFTL